MGISVLTSGLRVEGSVLGRPVKLTLPELGEEFGVTLRYVCGSFRGVIGENRRVFDWTPPLSLAAESPADSWVSVELVLEIRQGRALVGERSFPAAFFIPEEIRPKLRLEAVDTQGYFSRYGGFVQGKSRARLSANARGSLGSGIARTWLACGCLSGLGETLEFDLPEAGSCALRAVTRDTRGRKAEAEGNITVLAYAPPGGEIRKAERCGEDGEADEAGQWLCVTFLGEGAALGGFNTVSYTVSCCPEGEDSWLDYPAGEGWEAEERQCLIPAPTGNYALRLTVSDDFETAVFPYRPGNGALLDICADKCAIGIGCRGDRTGTISVGMAVQMEGNRLSGLPEPLETEDALPLGFAEGRYWRPRLLWENTAPGASFPAQTVAVEAAGFLLIEAAAEAGQGKRVFELCAAGIPGQLGYLSGEGPVYREFTWTDGGIVFQSASAGDTRAVPTRIFALTEVR